jgi:two-component system cell cycle response regulator
VTDLKNILVVQLAKKQGQDLSSLFYEIERTTLENRSFVIRTVSSPLEAREILDNETIDVILVEINGELDRYRDIISELTEYFELKPVFFIADSYDRDFALGWLELGVQDYLLVKDINPDILYRSIMFGMRRFEQVKRYRQQTIIDDMTGIFNRKGFLTMSDHYLKIASRKKKSAHLMYIDIDNLKTINDLFGHREGDEAIIQTAGLVSSCFRDSDITGRMGGDEFASFLFDTRPVDEIIILNRVLQRFEEYNQESSKNYPLSVSVGLTFFDPEHVVPLDTLIDQADKAMYVKKMVKKRVAT